MDFFPGCEGRLGVLTMDFIDKIPWKNGDLTTYLLQSY